MWKDNRKYSIDELPQMFNLLKCYMAIMGPGPTLRNQNDLVAESGKYKANDCKSCLTGWSQMNGRYELKIPIKAYMACGMQITVATKSETRKLLNKQSVDYVVKLRNVRKFDDSIKEIKD